MEDDDASFSDHSSQWGLESGSDDDDEYGWLDAALAESKAALLRSSIVVPDVGIARLEAASAVAQDEAQKFSPKTAFLNIFGKWDMSVESKEGF